MKTRKRYATAVLGSLSAAAILSGVALAGNPHGTPPGHAKGQVNSSVSVSAAAGNSVGVKSSSTTHFNTHAAAGSNGTKAYGNGSTAGQIAEQYGAGASADLYGPGNSQPHKTSVCGGKAHLVDVHALKAHGGAGSCITTTAGSSGSIHASGSIHTSTSVSGSAGATTHAKGGVAAKAHAPSSSKGSFTPPRSSGGVSGAQFSVSNRAQPAQAVLGAANFTG